jgi:hypothetical protein
VEGALEPKNLAKVMVASSNLVARSEKTQRLEQEILLEPFRDLRMSSVLTYLGLLAARYPQCREASTE